MSNAIKFNREGGQVRIAGRDEGDEAVVEVSDEGVGIPPEELERRLGLAITREIVERHGGRLDIESEVGCGSVFRIRLPRDR